MSAPKNRALRLLRKIHTWTGLLVMPLIMIIGITGFYLNHQKLFSPLLQQTPPTISDTVTYKKPLSREQAINFAKAYWGVERLSKVRKNSKKNYYKLSTKEISENMLIDINTRVFSLQTRYLRQSFAPDGAALGNQIYWKRVLRDLHTGRIGGAFGKFLADLVSLSLLLFALSGAYLWVKPKLMRRQRRQQS